MKTATMHDEPVFTLCSRDYNESRILQVYRAELARAAVGDVFRADPCNCGRDCVEETLTVIYKDDLGVGVVYRREGTTDSPNPESWEDDPELVWVETH